MLHREGVRHLARRPRGRRVGHRRRADGRRVIGRVAEGRHHHLRGDALQLRVQGGLQSDYLAYRKGRYMRRVYLLRPRSPEDSPHGLLVDALPGAPSRLGVAAPGTHEARPVEAFAVLHVDVAVGVHPEERRHEVPRAYLRGGGHCVAGRHAHGELVTADGRRQAAGRRHGVDPVLDAVAREGRGLPGYRRPRPRGREVGYVRLHVRVWGGGELRGLARDLAPRGPPGHVGRRSRLEERVP